MEKPYLKKSLHAAFITVLTVCFFISCKKSNLSKNNNPGPEVVVSTFAGGGIGTPGTVTDPIYGQIGAANGMGTSASFNAPAGVAIDGAGNIYVSEAGNHMIRKITPDGMVSTLAGNTVGGFANGMGSAASFSRMQGIAIDAAGNIYVADSGNQVIRKVTPAGVVTTFAGTGVAGADNGPASAATFNVPTGVAVDAAGNVYVVDFGNRMIRKISAAGIVSTIAGNGAIGFNDGLGAAASFYSPDRLALDGSGNIYVADFNLIRKITPGGLVSTFAGHTSASGGYETRADGKGAAAAFVVADGISTDAVGNIYVGDIGAVRKITPDGTVTTLAGGGTGPTVDGIGTKAGFGILRGLTVNAAGNLIYAADYSTSLIRKLEIK